MFHAPAVSFAAAAPLAPPSLPPLRPWAYLRLRREAAGLSIDDVATALSPRIALRSNAAALVRLLETPNMKARQNRPLLLLARVFPLDVAVYRQLAYEPADRHPPVCRGCGCSYWDPARGGELGSLTWAEPGVTCTGCADEQARAA